MGNNKNSVTAWKELTNNFKDDDCYKKGQGDKGTWQRILTENGSQGTLCKWLIFEGWVWVGEDTIGGWVRGLM